MQGDFYYKIADFTVVMNCQSAFMQDLCFPYRCAEDVETEIDLRISDEARTKCPPQMSPAMFEYNVTIGRFVQNILEKGAFCYHASALSVDGEGILFSADSGTGKSTHARLWREFMSADHEVISLNDDKPIIRLIEGKPWIYGSPWSGKHSIHQNGRAPVKALVFLERGEKNRIEELRPEEVFALMFPQVLGRKSGDTIAQLLELLDQFVRNISVYRLHCNISEEAVRLVYHTIWEEKENEN